MSNNAHTIWPELPECIGKLTAEADEITADLVKMEDSLAEYRSELDKLQTKYNVVAIEKQMRGAKCLKSSIELNILKASFKYIADCMYIVWKKLDDRRRKCFLKNLSEELGITYETDCNYVDFGEFCASELRKPYDDIDLTFISGGAKLMVDAEYYFMGEVDDRVELVIPATVLEDLSGFKVLMKAWYEEYTEEIEKEQELKQRDIDQRDYEEFLRLKKKFEESPYEHV